MRLTEYIEGTVDGVHASERGTGFLIEGQPPNTWWNFSNFLPKDHQQGLREVKPWPEVVKGQRVRVGYTINSKGARYIEVLPDGSHEFSVLELPQAAASSQKGYNPDPKGEAINWNVCLKAATDICIANGTIIAGLNPIDAEMVLNTAHELYEGGPSASGDLEKAAVQPAAEEYIGQYQDGDPGPQERPDAP